MKIIIKKIFILITSSIFLLASIATVSYIFIFTLEKVSSAEVNVDGVKDSTKAPESEQIRINSMKDSQITNTPALEDTLILVNPQNPLPDNYSHKIVHAFDVDMDQRLVHPYSDMRDAASKDGITLWISSAYRNEEKQEKLFKQAIQKNIQDGLSKQDAETKAALSIARPGHSEHDTGLALDFNGVKEDFDTTKEYKWLIQHATEYGFILRYPTDKQEITKIRYEPWHFRYVGIENAEKMKKMGLCLEEYIDYLTYKH